jgi:hypothetical protein
MCSNEHIRGGGNKRSRKSALALECLEARCVPAGGGTGLFPVTSLLDSGVGTLRAAITSANASSDSTNDIDITVTGTIQLESALPTITGSNVTILGPGSSNLAVYRDPTQGAFGIFTIGATTADITGIGIVGGFVANGGGVQNNGNLTLQNDYIGSNEAISSGGGVYNATGATLAVNNCSLAFNSAVFGGGIYNASNLQVSGGGAIYLNTVTNSGGGIYNTSNGTTVVSGGEQIYSNTAGNRGGGIYNLGGTFTWNGGAGDALTGNSATNLGGGIFSGFAGTVNLTGVSISGGNSAGYGGGCFVWSGTLTLTNITLTGNIATATNGLAGAMWVEPNSLAINTPILITDATGQYTPP